MCLGQGLKLADSPHPDLTSHRQGLEVQCSGVEGEGREERPAGHRALSLSQPTQLSLSEDESSGDQRGLGTGHRKRRGAWLKK